MNNLINVSNLLNPIGGIGTGLDNAVDKENEMLGEKGAAEEMANTTVNVDVTGNESSIVPPSPTPPLFNGGQSAAAEQFGGHGQNELAKLKEENRIPKADGNENLIEQPSPKIADIAAGGHIQEQQPPQFNDGQATGEQPPQLNDGQAVAQQPPQLNDEQHQQKGPAQKQQQQQQVAKKKRRKSALLTERRRKREPRKDYTVNSILAKRMNGTQFEYYITWRGFPLSHGEWVLEENMNCEEKVDEFKARWGENWPTSPPPLEQLQRRRNKRPKLPTTPPSAPPSPPATRARVRSVEGNDGGNVGHQHQPVEHHVEANTIEIPTDGHENGGDLGGGDGGQQNNGEQQNAPIPQPTANFPINGFQPPAASMPLLQPMLPMAFNGVPMLPPFNGMPMLPPFNGFINPWQQMQMQMAALGGLAPPLQQQQQQMQMAALGGLAALQQQQQQQQMASTSGPKINNKISLEGVEARSKGGIVG